MSFTNMKRNKASTNDSNCYEIAHFSSLILNVKILLLFYRSRFYRYSSYKCQEGGFNKKVFSLRDVNSEWVDTSSRQRIELLQSPFAFTFRIKVSSEYSEGCLW